MTTKAPGRWIVGALGIVLLVLSTVALSRTAIFAALTKSKDAFLPHAVDARVRYEPGADEHASAVAWYLSTAVGIVEDFHGGPFSGDVEVFVCASQESLNDFVALPAGVPIRGTVRFGQVFMSPAAFSWEGMDTHRESLTHELAHLYVRQHLGTVSYLEHVPGWFHEALANMVAVSGGEGISRAEATTAILEGRAFVPDSAGSLFRPKRAHSYGLQAPMLHKQSTMFLQFVADSDETAFQAFLADLLEEHTFAGPFRRHFGVGVDGMWVRFVEHLRVSEGP